MAIDWILDFGCQPKKLLGLGGVLDGAKIREQAARTEGDEPLKLLRITPDGKLDQEELTPAQLKARAAGYDVHAGHCRGCPANVLERLTRNENVFGCHGSLDTPLSTELELLLYVTLRYVTQHEMDAPGSRLLHFILETGIGGEAVRAARETLTARKECFNVVIDRAGEDVVLDTDQLLEALFFGERVEPQAAKFLFLPWIDTMERMIDVLVREQSLDARKRLADPGIVQLRAFGAAVKIAAELDCSVVVDL